MQSNFLKTLAAATMTLPAILTANPQSPTVINGTATFQTQGKTLKVTCSNRSIVNWQSYSIASGETTQYIQPNSNAVTLSRVVGANASSISGKITANGSVYLINPNGIIFGTKAVVNTAGFLASTLDVLNSQFIAGGSLDFNGTTTGVITNAGKITASTGDVVLLGYRIVNSGTVQATQGAVRTAAGVEMTLTTTGDERITIYPSAPPPTPTGTGIDNTATGQLLGFQAELKADGNPYALAIRNNGKVNATAVGTQNGRVIIYAPNGVAELNGTVIARNSTSECGGDVIVHAQGLDFRGEIDAAGKERGGFVDLSAGRLGFLGKVSTLDGKGGAGTLLLDPNDITITSSATNPPPPFSGTLFDGAPVAASNLNNTELATALGSNNVTIQTSSSTVGGSGDITFSDSVIWNSSFSLNVFSDRDTNINTVVVNDGSGGITITAGRDLNIGHAALGTAAQIGSRQGDIALSVGGDLNVIGGNVSSASAQLGYDAPSVASNITITTLGGDLNVIGGSADDAIALIGHGGAGSVGGTKTGDIQFLSGSGAVTILGGSGGTKAFAQVGHTRGIAGPVDVTGDVVLAYEASSMSVQGGSGGYALWGHGGGVSAESDAYAGEIKAQMGSLLIEGAAGQENFAAYGMVTFDTGVANQTMNSTLIEAVSSGPVTIHVADEGLALLGAAAAFGDGDIDVGSIHVETDNLGDLTLTADTTATANYLGLGAFGGNGTILANLNLVIDGDLKMTAGSGVGQSNIAIFSGEGSSNPAISAVLNIGGEIDLQANTGSVEIGSVGTLEIMANGGDLTVQASSGDAFIFGALDTTLSTSGALNLGAGPTGSTQISSSEGTLFAACSGDMTISGNGKIENGGVSNGNLVLTAQNIHVLADASGTAQISNLGSGTTSLSSVQDINIRSQIVNLGTGQWILNSSRDVNVGSTTADLPSQIGQVSGGPILVQAIRDLNIIGGDTAGAFAQIGADGTTVSCDLSILSVGGNLNLQGGGASGAFASIGHGRVNGNGGTHFGNIEVGFVGGSVLLQGGDFANTYAQIGHCHGTTTSAAVSGNVQATNITGDFVANGGSGQEAYALFGHGGYTSQGDSYTGDIGLSAENVDVIGGSGSSSFAAIGITNGQNGTGPAVTVSSNQVAVSSRGDTTLQAGSASLTHALIGVASETAAVNTLSLGGVSVEAIGSLMVSGSTAVSNGTGEIGLITDNGNTGCALTVNAGAGLTQNGNQGGAVITNGQGAPLGSYPFQSTIGGDLAITSAAGQASIHSVDTASLILTSGSLTLNSSAANQAFVTSENTMTFTVAQNTTLNGAAGGQAAYLQNNQGDFSLVAAGDLSVNPNTFIRNQGGSSGSMTVEGNNFTVTGSSGNAAFVHNAGSGALTLIAQTDMNILSSIQNPGSGTLSVFVGQDLNVGNGTQPIDCRLESSAGGVSITTERHVNVTAGSSGLAAIESQTDQAYSVGGDITLTGALGGNQATIQANNNDLNVIVNGTVTLNPNTFIQNQGGSNGNLSLSAGALSTASSSGNNSFIHNLGSGTYHLDTTNDMTINSRIHNPGTGDMDVFVGGNMVVGNGSQGEAALLGTAGGDILLSVTGDLTMTAGSAADLFAQIGGHAAAVGNALTVDSIGGNVTLNGGSFLNGYAQIGHRGLVITGSTTIGEIAGTTTLNPGVPITAYTILGNFIGAVIP